MKISLNYFLLIGLVCLINSVALCSEKMWPVELNHGVGISVVPAHPAVSSELLGISRPIVYRAEVDPGKEFVVAACFLERYWADPGRRVMDVSVEGAPVQTVDPVKDAGKNRPVYAILNGRDANNDGWLDIKVSVHPGTPDVNPIINILWVFDKIAWDGEGLTPDKLNTAQFDSKALYFVDCGVPGSEFVDLSYANELVKYKTGLAGMERASAADGDLSAFTAALPALTSEFDAIKKLHDEHRILDMIPLLATFRDAYSGTRGKIEDALAAKYKPAYRKSAETRLGSPWGAIFKIRQEAGLRLSFEAYPRPADQDYKWNSFLSRRNFEYWIDIKPDNNLSRLSDDLSLGYNLGLKQIEYDPFMTRYAYGDGSIDVRIMDTSAIVIQPKSITMTVTIPEYRFKFEDGIWRGKLDSRESSIYYGLVFRSPSTSVKAGGPITCKGMALVWADSPAELNAVIRKVTNWDKAQASARKWVDSRSKSVKLTANTPIPELFEINQRALDSVQFHSGAMLAALDGGYLFTWVRDTTNAAVFAAQAGDPRFLTKWAPYLMRNASNIEQDGKAYKSFFTFPGDGVEYGKKEQDGQFYGILTAYSYWKLTGDSSKLKEWYPILASCMEYQRKYYFDHALGLYWETSINEASLKSAPEWLAGERFPALKLVDDWPLHNLGIYINNLMYASHLMLCEIAAEVGKTSDSVRNLRMADDLADAVHHNLWNPADGYYRMGLARMETGELRPLDWNYWDSFFDYVWAYTLYPMTADPEQSLTSLDAILHKREGVFPGTDARFYFGPAYAHASYVYSAAGQSEKAKITLDRLTKRALDTEWGSEMSALYLMHGTIPENMGNVGTHRPEIFAIGPWMHAVISEIAYIDYNGVTIVPSDDASGVKDISFRGAVLSIDTGTSNDANGLVIDGVPVPHTLRVPNSLLTPGRHSIRLMNGKSRASTLLAHTDFELLDMKSDSGSVVYNLRGYGNGVLRFRGAVAQDAVSVVDPSGKPIAFRIWSAEGGTRIQVNAKGAFRVTIRA